MPKDIKLKLNVDSKTGIANIKKLEKSTKRFSEKTTKGANDVSKAFNNTSKSVDKTSKSMKKLIGLAAGLFSAYKMAGFIKDVALTAARFETLGVVMDVVGKNAGYSANQMNGFDVALRKTGISMVESRNSLARMAMAQLDLAKATQLGRIAQDAAVIGNINSSEAFQRLIYGIQSANVRVLRTIGINVLFERSYQKVAEATGRTSDSFSEAEKAIIRQNAVIKYGTRIAGTYEAAMMTAGKKITSFVRYIDDFKVKMGEAFGPATVIVVDAATEAMKRFSDEVSKPEAQEALERLSIQLAELFEDFIKDAPDKISSMSKAIGFLTENIDLLVIGIKALTYATAAFIGLSFIKFLIPIVGWVIKWGAGATILAVQIKSLGAYYMVAHGAIIKWMASLGIATGMAATFGTVVLTLTGYLTALAVAYYAIVKLGKERLARWFGIPMEDAKKFRAELDGIHKTQIKIAKESSKAHGYTGTWATPSGYTPKMEERPAWLKKQLKEIEELRAHTTMLEELEEKIAKQRLERMVHDTNAEIEIIIGANDKRKAEALKASEDLLKLEDDFNKEYGALGKTQLQLDIEAIEAQAEIWRKAGLNRTEIKKWETDKITELEKAAAKEIKDIDKDLNAKLLEGIKSWTMNFSNTLNEMLWGAEVTFADIAKSFAKMITQMLIQESMLKLIGSAGVAGKAASGILGALFSSEKGNVINNGAMMAYAKGGIVNSPTLFPMANGAGLMGEAGPEAILPLQRGKGGVLGVSGGGNNVTNTKIIIHMENPVFQDLETQQQTMAKIAEVVATRVAPGAVIQNYKDDLGIRQMIRGGN